MLQFLTVFPYAKNIHLVKDVGMIPYILHKKYGYVSTLATYNNCNYPYLTNEVRGLKLTFIKKIIGISTIDTLIFLFFNFKKYDVVQCYHLDFRSVIILSFYKTLKKLTLSKSNTYLKLDAVDDIRKIRLNFLMKYFVKKINLISVESKNIYEFLNKNNILGRRIEYIPNGFYKRADHSNIDYKTKENLIITVGRIGSYQKNTELLLEAFKDFYQLNSNWTLELIGPIECEFENEIQKYFEKYPYLIGNVIFLGNIENRSELKLKYDRSKIFILTSRYEGFPLVFLEAITSGCSIISTAFSSAFDITDNGKYGELLLTDNSKELTLKLYELISDEAKLEKNCSDLQNFANEHYSWLNICKNINHFITRIE
jgi:glycosyltransferase involved in cell wall biosynthesis